MRFLECELSERFCSGKKLENLLVLQEGLQRKSRDPKGYRLEKTPRKPNPLRSRREPAEASKVIRSEGCLEKMGSSEVFETIPPKREEQS